MQAKKSRVKIVPMTIAPIMLIELGLKISKRVDLA
jgi:hypothetical protein